MSIYLSSLHQFANEQTGLLAKLQRKQVNFIILHIKHHSILYLTIRRKKKIIKVKKTKSL